MENIPESKFEDKRSNVIEELVAQNVFKINGRQLYELSLYELMKEYTQKSLSS
ncbi:Fur-regulated basic protein FbpA [Planococcus beigongshangi]|uniref:Fur-regulated basic protein FbpA n=1 Tax=Planococcus beigongshangi TaxID=2782536 RepID=UPI00193B0A8E|nr:Fur-regulated basic protein FbpA [Planococcus beigongshangi]